MSGLETIPDSHNTAEGDMVEVIEAAMCILKQCQDMIELLPGDNIYTAVSRSVPGSTIGKHVRHLCDHFRLLFEGLDATLPTDSQDNNENKYTLVDYDRRSAQVPAEKDRVAAQQLIDGLAQRLEKYMLLPATHSVGIRAIVNPAGKDSVLLWSTWGRELWFCVHHAVHHHALIKAIGVEFDIQLPSSFGLAPSTERRSGKK
ncbi:hypothetical protein BDF19DRAFT_420740 [Syncephalis fuscata]|nr:hypothetical protein BDF19DRAFT_420740 [Syncephalis fuscata]